MYNYKPEEEIIEVDNFFPTYIQKEIANHLLDKSINWIYNSTLSYGIKSTYNLEWTKHSKIQETDGFSAQIDSEGSIYRQVTQNVKTFVKKNYNLDIIHFLRVMFVIIPPNPLYNLDYHMTPHIDSSDKLPYKNFLYYINDNDAETLFFNQKFHISKPTDFTNQAIIRRVKPKQNKAVIWDGSIFHAGNVSTSHKRLTLNILFK